MWNPSVIASKIKPNEYLVENKGYILDLKNYVNSSKLLFEEIDKDLKSINNYHLKSLKSYEFIKKFN